MVVSVAGKNEVQVTQNGQASLISVPYSTPAWTPPPVSGSDDLPVGQLPVATGILTHLVLNPSPSALDQQSRTTTTKHVVALPVNRCFPIKADVQRIHKSERLPLSTDELIKCIQANIGIDDRVFGAGLRKSVKITRKSLDIFDTYKDEEIESVQARLSDYEIARRAQGVLFDTEYLHPQELHAALMQRLKAEFDHRGIDSDEDDVERALNLLIATFPNIVRKAARQCAAKFKEVFDTAELPASIEYPPGARKSSKNVYGVLPQDLNEYERKFSELLDADNSGTVEYWFRNEPRKPWSIGIVLPNGDRYFPDFAIKVKDRAKGNGILLVEIKGNHILNGENTIDKVMAEHRHYGIPIMLVREDSGRFMTVKYNEKTDKNDLDQIFRVENLPGY